MSPLALTLLRFAFLGLLYLFVWMAVRQVTLGVAGKAGRRRIEPARAPRAAEASTPVAAPASLVIKEPGQAERTFALDGAIEVGRGEDVGLTLEDGFASHRHARLSPGRDGWQVEDLGSRNGTKVNGRIIDGPTTLRGGDTVRVGETTLEVRT